MLHVKELHISSLYRDLTSCSQTNAELKKRLRQLLARGNEDKELIESLTLTNTTLTNEIEQLKVRVLGCLFFHLSIYLAAFAFLLLLSVFAMLSFSSPFLRLLLWSFVVCSANLLPAEICASA